MKQNLFLYYKYPRKSLFYMVANMDIWCHINLDQVLHEPPNALPCKRRQDSPSSLWTKQDNANNYCIISANYVVIQRLDQCFEENKCNFFFFFSLPSFSSLPGLVLL
jgi:hypothetical protein